MIGIYYKSLSTRLHVALRLHCVKVSRVLPVSKHGFKMFNKQNSQLLKAKTPLQIPRRTTMNQANKISLETPLADYKRLIENMLNANLDDDKQNETYKTIAAEARNTVWKLLFDEPQPPTEERFKKASDLLKEHKMDACFFVPWDYNDWVIGLRDELIKRKYLDFWRNVIVKEQLGLCCARDSDYFDDLDDPEPAKFYRHAGCKPAWENETNDSVNTDNATSNIPNVVPSTSTASVTPPTYDYKIGTANPMEDYKSLVRIHLTEVTADSDEQIEAIYKAIAECARKTVWSLLFDEPQPPTVERQKKAGDLLKEHKTDAGFYAPWVYNEWVVKLKDEVLKRNLIDFWRNHFVKRELGLCWARDSDYFDDMEDAEPAKFYMHHDCIAPWLSEADQNRQNEHRSGDGK